MRLGLRGKFVLSLLATTMVFVVVAAIGWYSVAHAIDEALERNRGALRETARTALAERGSQLAHFLAEALTNPLYYSDLLAMREIVRSALAQQDVRYVLVYDQLGRVIHDGSSNIPGFGQVMDDALAANVVAASEALVQWDAAQIDASRPIAIGPLRLGGVRVGLSLTRMEAAVQADDAAGRERLRESLGWPLRVFAAVMLGLFGWIVLAGWLVARGLVRPIRELAAQAHEIELGRYDATSGSRRDDELGELIRAFGRMAEGVQRHHREIHKLAYRDSLTGLPNRLAFRQLLDGEIEDRATPAAPFALLFIDLDDFKRINDTLGHDVGDQVLVEFAHRFSLALSTLGREAEARIARLGGDEFVALVRGGPARQVAERAARSVLAQLKQPFLVGDKSLLLGASIGLTLYPDDAQTGKLLLKHGDLAMYQAKQQGKDCYRFFSGHLTEVAEERLALEHDLREAMAGQQLSLAYQPIYRLRDRVLVGAEALLRWQHPTRGAVPPSLFVPVAESSGLIDALGDWVIDRACRDAAEWLRTMPRVPVAINVSARQLLRGSLGETVLAALARHRLAANLLHLEMTESSLLHDEERAFAALAELRGTGVQVWLDDFGTGFSGLSHLRRARVDGVKIDRSFIADILRDPEDLALVSAIIAMAHSLGIQVIAEGVETEPQYTLLCERGCDLAQGFLLGKAVSREELLKLGEPGERMLQADN